MKTLRRHRTLVGLVNLIAITSYSTLGYADTLYKNNGDATLIEQATTAGFNTIVNHGEGSALTAGDIISYVNSITAAVTNRLTTTVGGTVTLGGIRVGEMFNGTVLNPGGAITIRNLATAGIGTQTLNIGASGIDMSLAGQSLTFQRDTANSANMAVVINAPQTWAMRTGRTLSFADAPLTLSNNVTIQGAGTVTLGGNGTGAISGAGNLLITGAQSGGATIVNLAGTNTAWTGAVTVGDGATHLRLGGTLNLDQSAASQNKLADAQTLTINNSSVVLLGTGGGTETVGAVALGRGLNVINRTAGTGILQANAITFGTGAALNVGNIGTAAGTSWLTTDNLNNNLILGGRMVSINGATDTNWVKNATNAADGAVIAASGADYTTNNAPDTWTTATQNILMTATGTAASTASRTINSLKIAHATAATAVTVDVGANTLTINDGFNGGGIIRNQGGATTIGGATIGTGSLTAGGADDSVNDTLYIWNSQNTININNVIKNNNTGVGSDTLHLFSGGAGTTTVHADNTYTGGTTIAAGTVAIGANSATSNDADLGSGDIVNHGTLVLSKQTTASLAQQTIANNITGTGAFTINRGTATLSGVNDYSGLTTVGGATTLRAGSATGISANSRMFLQATSLLNLNAFDVSVAALRGDSSTSDVQLGANTITLSGSELAASGTAESLTFVSQNYQGIISGTGNLIKNGRYTQVFTAGGALTYTGTTTVNGGILQFNKASATTGVTVNNAGVFLANAANATGATAAVNLAGTTSTFQVNNGFNQSFGSLTGVANSRLTIARGATATNITSTDNGGAPVTFSGVIQETGTGLNGASFTKGGTNTLILGGGNNYSGATTINGGEIQTNAANLVQVIPDRSAVVLADVAGAVLNINGVNETIGSLAGGGTTGGNVSLGAGRLTVGMDGTSTSFGGVISGTGGLAKLGNGTLSLTNNNTFTGAVSIVGGGLTLGAASPNTLATGTNVSLIGKGATLTVNTNQTLGNLTSGKNSVFALGTGATLSSGTAVTTASTSTITATAVDATVATFTAAHGLSEGMLLSGTNIPAGTFVRRVISSTSVELNQRIATAVTAGTTITGTGTNIIASQMTGAGGYTKEGTGTVWLSPSSPYAEYTNTGATTVNAGTLLIGGEGSANNVLSRNSALVVNTGGTVNFFGPNVNLRQYQEVGSLAGTGGTINLRPNNVGTAALVVGRDGTNTSWAGIFVGDDANAGVMKTGVGTLTLTGVHTSDNAYRVEQGGLTISGTGRLDDASLLVLSNTTGAIINYNIGANTDTVRGLVGGGRVAGFQPYTQGGTAFSSNFGGNSTNQTGGEVNVAATSILRVNSTENPRVFGGVLSGAGTFQKSNTNMLDLWGASTISNILVDGGVLRLGAYGEATGLGALSTSGFGSLSDTSVLTVNTGGTFDLNGATETIGRIGAGTGGTIALINGTLTTAAQTTLTSANVFTGNLNSVLNLGAASAATLTMTGNSNAFAGSINVGNNVTLANGTGANLGDTARINLNGTGTQFTVAIADTIGSLAGTGNTTLSAALSLQEARSGSFGSTTGYTGAISGGAGYSLSNFGGLTVSGNNDTTAGGITLSSGSRLVANYSTGATNILPNAGAITLNGSNIMVVGNPAAIDNAASLTLNPGASSVYKWNQHAADELFCQFAGNVAINLGAITRAVGGTIDFGYGAAATSTANAASGILGGYATAGKSSWAVANGTTAAISDLLLASYTADGIGAIVHNDITAGTGTGTAATLRFNGSAAVDQTATITTATGGILVTPNVGAFDSTISGALDSGTGNELIIHQHNTRGNLILSNVAGTNTIITTAGGGKTLINNNIAGTGTTNIGYGYLQIGSGGTTGMVGSGNILNHGTLGVNRSNAVSIPTAIISGTGNIEQLGSGTTTLGAANTYSGRTTVRSGTLEVTNNAGLGSGVTGVNRWGNLTSVNSGGTLSFTGGVTTVAELLNLDGGTLNIATTAASTYSAPLILSSSSTITLGAGTAVTHILSGQVIGRPGQNLTINGVASGSTLAFTNASNVINGNLTIGTNAIVKVGNNSAGTLGVTGSITNNGVLAFDSNDAHQFVNNTISGAGNLEVRRSSVWLTGDLSGATGNLIIPTTNANVQVFLGDHDFVGAAPGFANISVTGNAGGSSGIRFSQANNILTMGSNITLQPVNESAAANNRLTYFIKNNVGTLELTGKIAGEYAATSIDDRSYIETQVGGLLRVVTNAASNNYMMGLTAGVADPAKAFGGQIALQGDGNTARTSTNWSYFEITGDANQTISANITGGGNADQGGIFIYNSSGTLTLSPGTTATSAADGNTLFNSRNQINRGTVIFNGGAGGGAWRNDGFISVGSGATLQVNAAETTNIGVMKNGILALNAAYTQNGNSGLFAAGQITGTGSLTLNGNVTNRLNNVNNTFSGGLNLNRGQAQFTDAGSLGSGTINIASGASTEVETQLLQYVGLTAGVETVNNAINITGTTGDRQKGVASYGVGQLVIAGTVSVTGPSFFNLRGTSTGTHPTNAPFATWSNGVPTVSGQITGTGGLLKEDGGAWQLTNATNNFTGNIEHRNGRLIADSIAALGGATKTYNLGSGGNTPTLEFSSVFTGGTLASTVEMNLSGTTGNIRIVNMGSGAVTIADPTWTATGAGAKTLSIGRFDDVAGYTNVISGIIVNNSGTNTTALTKDGQSTWRLDGVNTFTGATTINNGVLQLGNAAGNTLDNSVDVNVNNAFGRGSTLELLTSETIDHLSGNIGATVQLNSNTLTIGSSNGAATYNGVIVGTGGITKIGTGAIGLGGQSNNLPTLGQSTYTGVTRINGGRIDTATLANGGVASGIGQSTSAANNLVLAGTVADSGLRFIGTRAQSTDRLLTLGPVGALSSPTAIWADGAFNMGINQSSISFNNTGDIGFTGAGARTLTLRGSTVIDNSFAPRIVDNAAEVTSLQKVEQSIWVISNANTYTGTTTVNGGTLAITNNAALGSTTGGTTITQPADNTRSFLDLRNVTVTGEALTYSGGANNNSSGFGASTGTNLWTGTVAVNQAAIVPVFSGATLELSGVVSGNNTINKLGAGTLILSGDNTRTTGFLARGGVVELNYVTNNGDKLADAAGLTLGAGAGGLAIQGQGAWNGWANATHTEGATIRLNGTTSLNSGVEIVSATTLDAGSSYVTRTSGTTILRLNDITRGIGGTLDVEGANMVQVDDLNVSGIIGGWLTFGKTDWAINSTAALDGAVAALAPASYTADTWAAANNVDVTTSTAQTGTVNSLRFNAAGANTVTLTAGLINTGGILVTAGVGANTSTITGGTLTAGNANDGDYDLIIHQYNTDPLVIGSNVINNAANAVGLTVSGAGPVVLTSDSNFRSGQTTINTGSILRVGNAGGAYGLAPVSTGTLGGNATVTTAITGAMTNNGSLIFDGAGADVTFNGAINGNGTIELASTNTRTLILNNAGNNYYGDTLINGGILALGQGAVNAGNNSGLNTPGLGSNIGRTIIGADGRLEYRITQATNPQNLLPGVPQASEYISVSEGGEIGIPGSVVNGNFVTQANVNLTHRIDLNNTTSGGAAFTINGNNHLSIGAIIKGTNGFTKTGNGILTLSGTNWIDGTPTLTGQVIVSAGLLYGANNARSFGGVGVGNEIIVQSGAGFDLRDTDFNFGDDPTATRKIIEISGTGVNATGALRNTSGTGTVTTVNLAANASIGGNSRIEFAAFDSEINPGITATAPVLNGGGFDLTKVGTNDLVMIETTINNLGKLIISEGELRAETRPQFPFATNVANAYPLGNPAGTPTPLANYPHTIFSAAAIPSGIDIVAAAPTADPVNTLLMNPIVGARLDLFRQHGAHHTANITNFGAASGAAGSYLELNSDTLPKVYTFWDGTINLTGLANGSNTFFNIEAGGAGTSVGNTVLGTQSPNGDQVVNPTSMLIVQGAITGSGGVTKIGSRELRLTGANTFTGDFVVMRQGNNGQPIDPAQNEAYANGWGASLYGNGTLANTSNVVLERRGMLRVINHNDFDGTNVNGAGTTNVGTNLTNRINDSATIKLRDGFLIFDSGNNNVTETLGTLRPESGDTFVVGNLQNGTNKNTTLTVNTFDRQPGSTLTFTSWDSTSTFGTTAPAGDDSFRIATAGTGLTMTGAGGATSDAIATGVLGGLAVLPIDDYTLWANATASTQQRNMLFFSSRDFMTLDSGYLRPLDDSEYYTNVANMAGAAGQNLNLSLPHTSVLSDLSVNSLRFGNLNDNLNDSSGAYIIPGTRMVGWQQYSNALTIDDGKSLTVSSGMVLFANMGQGQNNDMQSYINGGTLNFGANEGVITNVNGWYRTTDGQMVSNAAFIRSSIAGTVAPGSVGITKSGLAEVYFDGTNTYTGLTKVANGVLSIRNNMALGAGGTGNGVVIEGSGQLYHRGGVNIGQNTAHLVDSSLANNGLNLNASREDILVNPLSFDNQIFARSVDSVNRHNGNITLDLVDSAGITGQGGARLQPRLFLDANTTFILGGNMGGGNTAVSQDTYYNDARGWSLDGSAGWLILQGSVGDKLDGSGNAITVSGPVTNKPTGTVVSAVTGAATTASTTVTVANTLGMWVNMPITGTGIPANTTVTHINPWTNTLTLSQASTIGAGTTISTPSMVNENEVLRTWIGGSDHLNVEATQQWKALGRVELLRGFLRYTGTAGTDFYDASTLATLNGSEAGNTQIGFQIGGGLMKTDPGDNAMTNFLLTKAGQSLGVNNFTITTNANNNQGAVMIGGENETGTVRIGGAGVNTSSTIALGRNVGIYANAGGTVENYSRFTGGSISKLGRGTAILYGNAVANFGATNIALAGSTIGNIQTAGGELVLNYTLANNNRANGDNAVNFNGGALRIIGNTAANTTQAFANANDNQMRVRIGGSELSVQSATGRTTTLNMGRLASATDGAILSRDTGGTLNFVEFGNGGTAVITLAAKTGVTTNASIPWSTYGDAPRRALEFTMVDTTGNNVNAFGRALDEYNNDVATWNATGDISENGGSGFRNALAGNLTVNSLRFDANADSTVSLGANTLTVHGTTFGNFAGGGILVNSNVGTANKTITGGVLTTVNNGELIVHHYGNGTLNIGSQIGASGAAPGRVIVTGPSVTGADQLAAWSTSTTGQVVLSGANETAAVETRWLLNGSTLSIDAENRLGKVALAAATSDAVYMNGGALRYTGNGYTALDINRGFTIGGNGGVIDVVDGNANLQITSDIVSENWLSNMQTAATNAIVGGDLIKMGAGTLTLTGGTDANQGGFTGMIDVREGTLRVNGTNTATSGTQTISILGDNRTNILDGTIFRANTNFEVYLGSAAGGVTWNIEENLRFEGNNTIRFGIPGAANRTVGLNGVIDLAGDVTVDVVPGLTARFNLGNAGYMTGAGDLTKIGEGVLELRENNVLWSGGLNVHQGLLRLASQGLPGGVGTQNIMLGSTTHQGIAQLELYQENQILGSRVEIFQDIDVTYNPLQTKRLSTRFEAAAAGDAWVHGDITMSDNLGVNIIQSGRYQAGTYGNLYINGSIKDDTANNRSGNIVFDVTDENSGTANQQQIGEGTGYLVLRGNNSAWSGDLEIGIQQSYDQDEMSVVRLENANALTSKNDVLMRGSSALQIAGNNITIGSLVSNNAALAGTSTAGTANDGFGNPIGTTGTSAFIENASTTAATLTITQSTPANTQALWDVQFRDGQLPSHLLDNTSATSAALSVTKAGDGWATMSVDNTYTGTTTVNAGTLQVGRLGVGDTGATTAAGFTSLAGTTVAGTGVIQGATTISGALKPGDEAGGSMGTLVVNGNVTLAGTTVVTMQVQRSSYTAMNVVDMNWVDGASTAGYQTWITGVATDTTYSHMLNDPVTTAQHDQLKVTGSITSGGKVVVANNGYNPTSGDIFKLFDWVGATLGYSVGGTNGIRTGAETGTDLDLFELGGNYRWDVSQFNTSGFVAVVMVIPEPSRMMLVFFGLFGLCYRRRRNR